MKKTFFASLAALALAGCASYSELSRDVPAYARIDGGVKPIASYVVINNSYKLLGLLPLTTGNVWQGGAYDKRDEWNTTFFEDNCTLDANLASVKAALRECNTDRVCNIVNTLEEDSAWSCFLVNRRTLKTTCLICEPKAK